MLNYSLEIYTFSLMELSVMLGAAWVLTVQHTKTLMLARNSHNNRHTIVQMHQWKARPIFSHLNVSASMWEVTTAAYLNTGVFFFWPQLTNIYHRQKYTSTILCTVLWVELFLFTFVLHMCICRDILFRQSKLGQWRCVVAHLLDVLFIFPVAGMSIARFSSQTSVSVLTLT